MSDQPNQPQPQPPKPDDQPDEDKPKPDDEQLTSHETSGQFPADEVEQQRQEQQPKE